VNDTLLNELTGADWDWIRFGRAWDRMVTAGRSDFTGYVMTRLNDGHTVIFANGPTQSAMQRLGAGDSPFEAVLQAARQNASRKWWSANPKKHAKQVARFMRRSRNRSRKIHSHIPNPGEKE